MTAAPVRTWAERYAPSTREVYRRTLLELAADDPRILCLDSDMGGLDDLFGPVLPEQYVNVGIAEANLVSVAAGLAATGFLPYANTMSGFASARACEQVKIDVAHNNLPVRIVGTHGGFSAGHYGPTHHALEDLAILRTLPNLTVVVPADSAETEYAVRATAGLPGPLYLRLGRNPAPPVYDGPYQFRVGEAVRLRQGEDVTIVATGPHPVTMALEAARALAVRGISARVLNVHTVKPFDTAAIAAAARETGALVTVEDHVLAGGLGSAVCEVVAGICPVPVRRIGVADRFHDSVGTETDLLDGAGVSARAVEEAVLSLRSA
ncbi:transketolase C-terminal domain-containing protein [Amycolatopsis sp. NPDC049253]|uniref:transketolase family protein n=1 Tax=Amycolatopsis sp. NPDC049253 TaxID=3155274 RepID=UPI0034277553